MFRSAGPGIGGRVPLREECISLAAAPGWTARVTGHMSTYYSWHNTSLFNKEKENIRSLLHNGLISQQGFNNKNISNQPFIRNQPTTKGKSADNNFRPGIGQKGARNEN
ncbi:hypothetical protein chiPu_0006206 [Chiloscyllium punctatum]|uniref:Uncharacterized protein n=1 Tax=Chiloscyllium punctatum TaxID=137246 RepID=A0A401SBQ0_CHIPU|nr:hypothetical protein [Chiloscyllium punctatum]